MELISDELEEAELDDAADALDGAFFVAIVILSF